jgi:hypothetical protein
LAPENCLKSEREWVKPSEISRGRQNFKGASDEEEKKEPDKIEEDKES